MKIKYRKLELVEYDIEIDFPFYGYVSDSLDSAPVSWDKWVKIEESGECTVIKIEYDGDDVSYEIRREKAGRDNALAAYGAYSKSSEAAFMTAIAKIEEALRRYG